ncbi:MAG: class I SAM-dependent methyltransferase [Thermoanaerobaculia bacterium]
MTQSPLHAQNPTGRFAGRAEAYARWRPDYPASALASILGDEPRGVPLVDLGAGTGISSRQLASRGARVVAIEPNPEMCALISPMQTLLPAIGTAESIPLRTASVRIATAFQAFHWFDAELALAEIHRVLVPGGRLALVWNERDDRDPFTAAYREIVRAASGNHPAESRMEQVEAFAHSALFLAPVLKVFPHEQRLDREGLVGRMRSTSYLPSEGAAWESLASQMEALRTEWADANGFVRLAYETRVWLAKRC